MASELMQKVGELLGMAGVDEEIIKSVTEKLADEKDEIQEGETMKKEEKVEVQEAADVKHDIKGGDGTEQAPVDGNINKGGEKIESEEKSEEQEKAPVDPKTNVGGIQVAEAEEAVCEKCGDSGIFEGYYCECVKKRMAKESINSPIPPFTFEESDLSLFRKDKELAERAYETMRIFCAKFPHTKNVNLLFIGNAGTGKTFLASCVANELERQGRNVLFLSAFRFNDICLKYHTSFDNARTDGLNAVIDAELLVIDDLGTESILKNVTKEYLYTVISERMNAGRHTIITTNLNESMLEARYGERIVSRLFTTRACLTLALTGEDLRR